MTNGLWNGYFMNKEMYIYTNLVYMSNINNKYKSRRQRIDNY